MKLDSVEVELNQMVEEQRSWDKETRSLRSQLDKAEEMVRGYFLSHTHTMSLDVFLGHFPRNTSIIFLAIFSRCCFC